MLARNDWNVEATIEIVSSEAFKKRRTDIVSYIPQPNKVSQNMVAISGGTKTTQSESVSNKNNEVSAINQKSNNINLVPTVSNTSVASHISTSTTNSTINKPLQQEKPNKTNQSMKKITKKRRNESESNAESDDETARPKDRVFNSDDEDSDDAPSFHMTKDRREVFNFINKASVNELQQIKSCSLKKIDTILELRPFRDWQHMMQSFQSHKTLSAEVLNYCQEYLASRNSMVKVMDKCEKIVKKLESSVAAGGGLFSQPSILNSNFKLADYQLVGLNWLVVMNQEETNGILADEMGLGKTIQVIAFLAYLKETGQAKYPHLIVVPSSTLDNWDQEFAK